MTDLGPAFTSGSSFRAHAEAAQRRYRTNVLGVPPGAYRGRAWGHFLDDDASAAGLNFVHPRAHVAMQERVATGKGIDLDRTTRNMLASQAIGFNLFAPIIDDAVLAARVFRAFAADLDTVRHVHFEFTAPANILGDQDGGVGVDHDLLVEYVTHDGDDGLLAIETKFVEKSFSTCGYRGRSKDTCPDDVAVAGNRDACPYQRKRGYRYWQRSDELDILAEGAVAKGSCPFGGPCWQLWTNATLVHALAKKRGARATFAVCAPAGNEALFGDGVLDDFRALLAPGIGFTFVPVESVLDELVDVHWYKALEARYRIGFSPARKTNSLPLSE